MLTNEKANKKMLDHFIGGQKRKSLAKVDHCQAGYIFADNSTKIGKVLAFPKGDFRRYEAIIFDMQNGAAKFKGFRVRGHQDYKITGLYDRQVAFVNRAVILAEAC